MRDAHSESKISAIVRPATKQDLAATRNRQTCGETPFAAQLPNKVALCRSDNGELLGLMPYELEEKSLVAEIIYAESARHSNANLLHAEGGYKRYYEIAEALFAYAVQVSLNAEFDSALVFKAETSDLLDYYAGEFCARRAAAYDPFRMIIWEDAAEKIVAEFRWDFDV